MNHLVKLITNDDGEKINSPVWHLVYITVGDRATLCTLECFGSGQSSLIYKTKSVDKGGITCPDCIEIIKKIKAVKL